MNKDQLLESLLAVSSHEFSLSEEDLEALTKGCEHIYNLGKISMLKEIDKREFLLNDWIEFGSARQCIDDIFELLEKSREALEEDLGEDK